MITPQEIQDKIFRGSMSGYNKQEVRDFLKVLSSDVAKLSAENTALNEQLKNATEELERYRNTEDMILETLESARDLMEEISTNSRKKAELILDRAEAQAAKIVEEARNEVEKYKGEEQRLKANLDAFNLRYKTLLQDELDKIERISLELLESKEE